VHNVQDPLEQQEVRRIGADSSTDDHAIVLPCGKPRGRDVAGLIAGRV
jgi:hypothetical protein